MVWSGYYRYQHFGLNLPVLYYLVANIVLVLTMVLRPSEAGHVESVVLAAGFCE
jgi:hypothetical protein